MAGVKKRTIVLSLGGSLIVPDDVDVAFLKKFKATLKANSRRYKFVVVCGGGSVARKYISALKAAGVGVTLQSMSGISATRMNARFMSYFFGADCGDGIPHDMKQVKGLLRRNDFVFCGALRYAPNQTSDSTAAKLANYLGSDFINLTNVDGLYDRNPLKSKNARFIPEISWSKFLGMASSMEYRPGQHFVLDQTAAKVIEKNRVKTYILGKNLKNLDSLLRGRAFKGTTISG